MAKNSIRDYSATSSLNTDVQSVDISEGCAASGINNALREIMADLKDVSSGTIALETPSADQLNVDNIRIDGNTISSTDTNGDITLDPDGTGDTVMTGPASATPVTNAVARVLTTGSNPPTGNGGGLVFAQVNSGGTNQDYASITGSRVDSTANNKVDLVISTGDPTGGTAIAERVRVDTAGNVGIGTASPGYPMQLASSSGAGTQFGITYVPNSVTLLLRAGGGDANVGTVGSHPLLLKTNNTEAMRIEPTYGRLLINRTSASAVAPYSKLHVLGDAAVDVVTLQVGTNGYSALAFLNASGSLVGSVTANASSTSYNTSSDHRLKENVADMTGAIDRVKALAPKRFNFIADADTTVDGFIAHEAQTVVPEAVTGTHNEVDEDGNPVMQGIDQSKLVPLLTAALKESIAKIEALETRIEALETA